MDYTSPGDAFSSSLERSLLIRAQQKRQALEDDLASKREARLNQAELDSAQERQDRIRQHGEDQVQAIHDKTVGELEKRASKMVPGDIPDPEMMATADKVGVGGTMFPKPAESMPGIAAVPVGSVRLGMPGPADASVRPYIGDAKQRQAATDKDELRQYIDTLPDGPEKQAQVYFLNTGKTAPAGMFPSKTPPKPRLIFDPVKRSYTDASGNAVTDVPDGAVVDRAAEPRDTSAGEARNDAHVQTTKEHAYTEFNNEAKPVEDQIRRIQKFTTNLGQGNNIADSTLAEQLVTLTAGGTGSGVRLSQPMLDQVFKSRTKYDDLQVALRKWSVADPKDKENTSLFFTAEQKQEMVGLARAYRHAANDTLKKITTARMGIDAAKSVDEVNRLRTKAHMDIFADAAEDDSANSAVVPAPVTLPPGVTVTKRKP